MSGTTIRYTDIAHASALADADETYAFQQVSGDFVARRATLSQLRTQLVKAGRNISIAGDGTIAASSVAWHNNAGVPPGGIGADFDYCINTVNGDLYQKLSGTWQLIGNIRGPSGALATADSVTVGTSGNILTIDRGATSSAPIVFSQSGTGGLQVPGPITMTGTNGALSITGPSSSYITLDPIGTKLFRYGYSVTKPLLDLQSAGTNTTSANQYVFRATNTVTHDGTGSGAYATIYGNMTVNGQPQTDYYAGGFLTYVQNLADTTGPVGHSQHGALFSHLVKTTASVPGGTVPDGRHVAEGWVQWWVLSDRTGLPSSKAGALVGVEIDIDGNCADDADTRFVRQAVLKTYVKDAAKQFEFTYGDYWNSTTGGVDDAFFNVISAYYAGWTVAAIDLSQGTGQRGNPYIDGVNRAVGIKMRDGVKLAFAGDGATGQYLTHGSSRLQWWSAGAEQFSIGDTGKIISASTATDSFTFPGGGTVGPDDYRQVEFMPDGAGSGVSGSPHVLRVRRVGSDNTVGGGTSLWVFNSSWQQTNTTAFTGDPGPPRFNSVITTGQLAGSEPGSTWNLLSTMTVRASDYSKSSVATYSQIVRAELPSSGRSSIGVPAEAMVVEARDTTGAPSSQTGQMRTLELDLFANGDDDYGPVGIGREVIPIVLGKGTTGASPTITSLIGVYPTIGDGVILKRGITFANQLNFTQSLWDTRDSVQGASANALWLRAGHRIALDGDSTGAATPSTNYIYSSSGSTKIHAPTIILGDGQTAPFTVTSANITAATSQNSTLATGGVGYYWAIGRDGYGNVIQAQSNTNGTSHGGASPNELLVPGRLKVGLFTSTGTTYTLSGSVTPSSVVGDGTTVVVTYPAIANRVIPVGSTMTLAGWSIGAFNGTWTVAASDTVSATLTCAATGTPTGGTVTYNMAPITPFLFGSNWAGKPTASKVVPYRFFISSDTADTVNTLAGMPVVGIYHNWSGAATGAKHGLEVEISQTGPTNDPRVAGIPNQQHTVINAHAWGKYNAGGTGTFSDAAGSLYGLNPQTKLLAGATHWRLINALGEVNSSVAASSVVATVGGTITAGNTVSLQFASADIAGSPVTATWTVGASQTLTTVGNALAAEINATAALRDAGISAVSNTDGTLTIYWPTFLATLTITPSTSGGATETLTLGAPVSGASVDIKTLGSFIRLADDHGRGEMNSAMLIFGSQSGAARSGDYLVGLNFGGLDGYDGQWPLHERGTLLRVGYQTANGGSAKNAPLTSPVLDHGLDLRYVDFGLDAWRSPGVRLANSKVMVGGHRIYADANGLSIDVAAASGNTASAVALASGGGGGAGSLVNNYFKDDRGYIADGVLRVTGVDPSTGAVTAFNVETYPSHDGTLPSNPVAVEGGSGIGWTVDITWPAAPALRLQPSGGATTVGGTLELAADPVGDLEAATKQYVDNQFWARMLFGTGSDGDVTLTSGTTTMARDMCYRNLTLSGTAILDTNGFRLFVLGTLDISAAGAMAIRSVSNGFSNSTARDASGATGGTFDGDQGYTGVQHGAYGVNGANGGTGAGANGGNVGSMLTALGGRGGSAGAGGSANGGAVAGGSAGTIGAITKIIYLPFPEPNPFTFISGLVTGGGGGPGAAGAGDGTNAGGGGGGPGIQGSALMIFARNIVRGAGTAAGAIFAKGTAGGKGGNAAGGNAGGGGGGGGGGGSCVYLVYETLSGSTATNAFDVSGGDGGAGGDGSGTGSGGYGGSGGRVGSVQIVPLFGTASFTTPDTGGSAGSAPSGTTGGAGGAGAAGLVNL